MRYNCQAKLIVKDDRTFTVLYVGRGTAEKRVKLVTEIAKQLYEKKEDMGFEIMGDVSGSINKSTYPFIKFYGNINNENTIVRYLFKGTCADTYFNYGRVSDGYYGSNGAWLCYLINFGG